MFPGVRITEMFAPLATIPADNGAGEPDVGALVAAGLSAPASPLGGWRPEQLSPAGPRSAPFVPGQTEKLMRLRLGPPRWWSGWQVTARSGGAKLVG